MPIGKALDARDEFHLALGHYYKIERKRAEQCLGDIIDILGNADDEPKQVQDVLSRLTTHYSRTDQS